MPVEVTGTAGDLERVNGARALKSPDMGADDSLEEFAGEALLGRETEEDGRRGFGDRFLAGAKVREYLLPRRTGGLSMSVSSSSVLSLDCELFVANDL